MRWLTRSEQSGLAPLMSLANGIRRDYAAVKAGVTLEWSNGPTEGHINRLKQVKRQMYGRAKLDLLKLRLMALWHQARRITKSAQEPVKSARLPFKNQHKNVYLSKSVVTSWPRLWLSFLGLACTKLHGYRFQSRLRDGRRPAQVDLAHPRSRAAETPTNTSRPVAGALSAPS